MFKLEFQTFYLMVLHCFLAIQFAAPAWGQDDVRRIALFVGVSDYESGGFENLKYAENDVTVVGGELQRMGFEVTSVLGKEATREKTNAAFDRFMEKASELETSDIVLVMFSGHGQQIRVSTDQKVSEVPYFCPYDALPFDESKITTRGKSESEIGEELNFVSLNRVLRGMDEQSNSLNNLLVVDACRNNPSKGKSSGISGTSANVPQGVNILFAASSGQKSWESIDKNIRHGVFSHFLIKGLRGKAKNSRGQVTWSRLASYLQEEVAFAGPALAGAKERVQNPHSIINSSNLIVLSGVRRKGKASAGNWTRFRGENGQGKIAFSNIPLEWSESKNIRWKYKLPGSGASSPIVFDGQVFVTAYSGFDKGKIGRNPESKDFVGLKKHLLAIDLRTGERNWIATVDGSDDEERHHQAHGYASHTPVTDGEKIYAYFGRSGVYAYDLGGESAWNRKFENKESKYKFGGGGSSIVLGDRLIVNSGCETQKLHALNTADGSVEWGLSDLSFDGANSTPVAVKSKNATELVMTLQNKCVGIDSETGKFNWEHKSEHSSYQMSSPLIVGDHLVFGRPMIRELTAIKKDDPKEVAWTIKVKVNSTPIEFGDAILCFQDRGVLTTVDRTTGDTLDKQRLEGFSKKKNSRDILSSPVLVGDHVIAYFKRGDAFVIGKEGGYFKTKFVNQLGDEEETFLATPAVTQNELLIRSDKYLYCISKD